MYRYYELTLVKCPANSRHSSTLRPLDLLLLQPLETVLPDGNVIDKCLQDRSLAGAVYRFQAAFQRITTPNMTDKDTV
jgi:hypothetical protein